MFKKIFFLVLMAGFILLIPPVQAASPFVKSTENLNKALGNTGLEKELGVSIGVVVNGILSLVGTIFLVLTIYAGILWMTAQGSEEKVKKAKDIIQASIIGLFVVLAAYAITAFVTTKFNEVPSTPIPEAQPVP